ncbi:MAG: NTP transferase domain-containing protein [Dehalococcoidia bacterium]|nr:NTP transferase domain-containing protein [Dehalococcoidia bacterium]
MQQAVILAAGEGQRLRPFTASKPKVMIPIAGKPILGYVIEAAAQNGIRKITIVVGYRKEQVIDCFGAGEQYDVEITYVDQRQQLGTAHALKQAKGTVSGTFLALSGDNIIEANTISDIVKATPNTILVKEQDNVSKYGVIKAQDGVVTSIVEKPKEAISPLVNTGIYAFHDDIFDVIGQETDLTTVLRDMIAAGRQVGACFATGAWLDVVYPWDILKLNDMALSRISPATGGTIESGVGIKGLVSIGKGSIVRSNSYIVGPVTVGENCEIGPGICILPSTSIGDNVCLAPFSLISNSIIADGVEIGPGSILHDSIVDRGTRIKGHLVTQSEETEIRVEDEYHRVHIGAMIGEHCSIGGNAVTAAGVIIGNRSKIRPLKFLEGCIPDESLVI